MDRLPKVPKTGKTVDEYPDISSVQKKTKTSQEAQSSGIEHAPTIQTVISEDLFHKISNVEVSSSLSLSAPGVQVTHSDSDLLPIQHPAETHSIKLTANEKSELKLYKSISAPIEELKHEEATSAINHMIEDIKKDWKKVSPPLFPQSDDVDKKDWKDPQRTFQQRWNEKIDAVTVLLRSMLGSVEKYSADNKKIIGYFVGEKPVPVGVLMLSNTLTSVQIDKIATHPGSETVGGSLLEKAVQLSQLSGHNGKVSLRAVSDDSQKAYEALGFVSIGGRNMELNPKEKLDIWEEKDGQWCLKKYMDKKFIQ